MNREIILAEWNGISEKFFREARLVGLHQNVKIHVFFNKGNKEDVILARLQKHFHCHLVLHESLTNVNEAAWTDLLAYLINFYTKTLLNCQNSTSATSEKPKQRITLVSAGESKYAEIEALLISNKTKARVVDGSSSTIFDLFTSACTICEKIFVCRAALEKHNRKEHNFSCPNVGCVRSKKENGFYNYNDLQAHMDARLKCPFCQYTAFCDPQKHTQHMKDYHVLCACPCAKYYIDTDEYIEHYCTEFPLPCLEEPTCKTRFKNIDQQAFHHKAKHGATHPYFCLACYSQSKLTCVRNSDELMSHVSDFNHSEHDFQMVVVPNEIKTN